MRYIFVVLFILGTRLVGGGFQDITVDSQGYVDAYDYGSGEWSHGWVTDESHNSVTDEDEITIYYPEDDMSTEVPLDGDIDLEIE
jgi:hypothetical protein